MAYKGTELDTDTKVLLTIAAVIALFGILATLDNERDKYWQSECVKANAHRTGEEVKAICVRK
jgi:hypothetical protein